MDYNYFGAVCDVREVIAESWADRFAEQAEQGGGDVNETVDEAIRTLVCFLD